MPLFGFYNSKEVDAKIADAIKARETDARHLLQTAGREKWELPDMSLYRNQAELFRRLPALSTVTELLLDSAAMLELQVLRKLANQESEEIPNHELEVLMIAPNPLQSGVEFWQETIGFRTLTGNCYWWYNRPNATARPLELWILPPDKIQPVPDERLYLRGYVYDAGDGIKIPLETWEVEHFKRFNPFNRFVGLSVIEALAITAMGDIASNKWNTQLFGENNARLPGILAFADPIADADWDKMKAETQSAANKRQLLMLRGSGKGGVEWMQAAATHREMEFLEGREFSKREVWDALAPGASSMLDPSATEASSKTGETVFRNYALYNRILKPMESRINRKGGLMESYGEGLFAQFKDIRITDRALELQEREAYDKVHTIEEIRQEHYGDKPLGDERDKKLPSEVKAFNPNPEPFGGDKQKPKDPKNNQDLTGKADYSADLIKWRERAKKRGAGKSVSFDSDVIPDEIHAEITAALPLTKSVNDIKLLFGRYIASKADGDALLISVIETAMRAYEQA